MGVNSVNSISSSLAAASSTKNKSNELGKDEFLNLLITQLKYQDPLNPADNTEYISQLAQFSSLEQMNNMASGINSMQALSMTGKMVSASITDSTTGEATQIQGVVDSVKLKNGVAVLMVNGTEVPLESVSYVYEYNRDSVSSLSSLIGQQCKGYVYDAETLNVVNVEGKVTGIEKGTYEDYAVMNGVEGELDSILSSDYKKPQTKLDYLNNNIGNEIEVSITDSSTGKKVPVTAELSAVNEADGKIIVTLNKVKVPVDSIFSVDQNA